MNSTMTWDQAVSELGIKDLDWNGQVRAVAAAFGSEDDESFIDWLINGAINGDDTIDAIYQDWEEEQD